MSGIGGTVGKHWVQGRLRKGSGNRNLNFGTLHHRCGSPCKLAAATLELWLPMATSKTSLYVHVFGPQKLPDSDCWVCCIPRDFTAWPSVLNYTRRVSGLPSSMGLLWLGLRRMGFAYFAFMSLSIYVRLPGLLHPYSGRRPLRFWHDCNSTRLWMHS